MTVAIQNKQLVCITFRMVSIRTSPVHQWAFSDKPRLFSLLIIFRIFRKWLIGVCLFFFFEHMLVVVGGPEIPESDEISGNDSRTGRIFGSHGLADGPRTHHNSETFVVSSLPTSAVLTATWTLPDSSLTLTTTKNFSGSKLYGAKFRRWTTHFESSLI